MRKILIDNAIPYLEGVFEPYFCVERKAGNEIQPEELQGVEALVVRTRTRCDAALLNGTSVRLIATATIGVDHIDQNYCTRNKIEVVSAAGCNARAVAQWVGAALRETDFLQPGMTLGIVGVGHVGREVVEMAEQRGLKVLRNDPPRAAREGSVGFVEIDELLAQSDAVTIHVPLDDSTRGMVDSQFLTKMKPNTLLLNSSRGEVVDPKALKNQTRVRFALDVWPSEPNIDAQLLALSAIGTPHVAGYSARGKARASAMVVQAIAQHFSIQPLKNWQPTEQFELEEPETYDILTDDQNLRREPKNFEALRRIRKN